MNTLVIHVEMMQHVLIELVNILVNVHKVLLD